VSGHRSKADGGRKAESGRGQPEPRPRVYVDDTPTGSGSGSECHATKIDAMTLLRGKALDVAIESADDAIQAAEAHFARTPDASAAYPLSAPSRQYAWRAAAGGGRGLVARTDSHGPAALHRVVDRGASVDAEALPLASADVAGPTWRVGRSTPCASVWRDDRQLTTSD
jgi:hypothetical protein